ncbi:Galectin [Caenorhabditis elegans]|nr:Galectin [Caenorhabditis elegans]CTQ86765.1 Galectin [Caenorhabditis elegans]|eukprot:NP_001300066.1 Galectin [Caenorhabditis elegans]
MVLPGFASDRKRFQIDLCCGLLIDGDHMDNKALHFNPRFDAKTGWFSGPGDDKLVINSFVSGRWGNEERFDNPFKEGEPFQIRIMVFEKYFKISASGKHMCDFPHRVPVESIRTISINGNIRVDYVEFHPPIGIGADGKPTLVAPTPKQEVITKIDKPNVPFELPLPPGGFVSPQSARFTITPFLSSERFTINLKSKGEFLFHFRVDMPNQAQKIKPHVIRNSSKNGVKWLTEERTFGTFPFHKGITHDIVFTAYGKSVTVDVDGAPFVKFVYRDGDDPVNVDQITVVGDVLIHRFEHKG